LPPSTSAIIFNLIHKVGTAPGFLAFSFDFADRGRGCFRNKVRHKIIRELIQEPLTGSAPGRMMLK
jgi:hypothetical protein